MTFSTPNPSSAMHTKEMSTARSSVSDVKVPFQIPIPTAIARAMATRTQIAPNNMANSSL